MIFTQDGYNPGDNPAGVPLIGYDNQITSIDASSGATGYPASNLLNSATHLIWKASSNAPQQLAITPAAAVNYLAIASHNLNNIGVSLFTSDNFNQANGTLKLLAHFEGTNGGTDYYDSSGGDYAFGRTGTTGTLTNTQFKFGAMSLAFNASGYVTTAADVTGFGTSDFTIDFWVRISATGTSYYFLDTGDASVGMSIRKTTANVIVFRTGNTDRITGTTALTTGQWYHIALARSGTSTKLFLDGTQEGSTYTDSNHYSVTSTYTILGGKSGSTDLFNGFIDELRVLYGAAAFTSNFAVPTAAYADTVTLIAGNYTSLLHFDGVDASTTITDSGNSDHVWTAVANAQIDTAQSKFGGSSLLLDGTGDYVQGDGSGDLAMGDGNFTIDFWYRPNATGIFQTLFDTRPLSSQGPYISLYVHTGNTIRLFVNSADRLTSTTTISVGTWMHIALTRVNFVTNLWINGVREGGDYADTNNYLISAGRPIIGADGSFTPGTFSVNGWLEEFRIVKGTALFFGTFVPPTRAAGSSAIAGKVLSLTDAAPIIFRFSPSTSYLSLNMTGGTEIAQIGVIYAGTLLVLERGVKADVQHTDIVHARRSNVLAGMSESGNFLGRVLISEWRESQAEFAWFTPSWYRAYFEPFAESAMTDPFFWAWNPDEYPEDTAFAWIIEEVRPETDPATRRMAATISMRAIA